MERNIAIIMKHLSCGEVMAQLAEECDELGHAALKMRRTIIPDNPTPITEEEAYKRVMEEIADIALCIDVLGINNAIDRLKIEQIKRAKAERWAKRLQEGKC